MKNLLKIGFVLGAFLSVVDPVDAITITDVFKGCAKDEKGCRKVVASSYGYLESFGWMMSTKPNDPLCYPLEPLGCYYPEMDGVKWAAEKKLERNAEELMIKEKWRKKKEEWRKKKND